MQGSKPFSLLHKGCHQGKIISMDAHEAGSLVVTGGADHTLRCFDAALGYCIAAQNMADTISAVALHPARALVLVAQRTACRLLDVTWCAAMCIAWQHCGGATCCTGRMSLLACTTTTPVLKAKTEQLSLVLRQPPIACQVAAGTTLRSWATSQSPR